MKGCHKRLRIVHTIEFGNGGSNIQIMRVAVYEEQWVSPANIHDERYHFGYMHFGATYLESFMYQFVFVRLILENEDIGNWVLVSLVILNLTFCSNFLEWNKKIGDSGPFVYSNGCTVYIYTFKGRKKI